MFRIATTIPLILVAACTTEGPAPVALSNQPVGGPCSSNSDCASGLQCLAFQTQPQSQEPDGGLSNASWQGGNLCTLDCADGGACPAGTTCLDASQFPTSEFPHAVEQTILCVPTCSTNSNCEIGSRAQVCVSTDGGLSICEELLTASGDSACAIPNCTGASACPAGFQSVAIAGEFSYCGK